MADKKALPPPPGNQSAWANMLGGVKSALASYGMYPVAESRITRTPIYGDFGSGLSPNSGGMYSPFGNIVPDPQQLQEATNFVIPHESTHALFDKAKLGKVAPQLLQGAQPGEAAMGMLTSRPDLYPHLTPETIANEGLAYSVGEPAGTPFVEHVARQIKDPAIAQQLLRLHHSTLASRHPQK